MQGFLVDTSLWISHLKSSNSELIKLLSREQVYTHSSVIGELACGSLSKRHQFINDIQLLPKCTEATAEEVLIFIEQSKLYAKGLGLIDIQLLASARISNLQLLTLDKKLLKESFRLGSKLN